MNLLSKACPALASYIGKCVMEERVLWFDILLIISFRGLRLTSDTFGVSSAVVYYLS